MSKEINTIFDRLDATLKEYLDKNESKFFKSSSVFISSTDFNNDTEKLNKKIQETIEEHEKDGFKLLNNSWVATESGAIINLVFKGREQAWKMK